MINSKPVNLYVDSLKEDYSVATVTNKKIVAYDLFKINELRNYKSDFTIDIKDESTIVQAGIYVCIKMATTDLTGIELYLFDPTKNDLIASTLIKDLDETDQYLYGLVNGYIIQNYEALKGDVNLVVEQPWFVS